MRLQMVIAPDFAPSRYAGWYFFATMLQKYTDLKLKLHLPTTADEQLSLINHDKADFVYANPYDSALLIREKGYRAVAQPVGAYDEMVIITRQDSPINSIMDIPSKPSIALAANKDVEMIGLRLLEPADLALPALRLQYQKTFQAVVRALLMEKADIGFLLANSFTSLSASTRAQLKVIQQSDIQDIRHVLLAHKKVNRESGLQFLKALLSAGKTARGKAWLAELGIPDGFSIMLKEDGEFMIDLMETLQD